MRVGTLLHVPGRPSALNEISMRWPLQSSSVWQFFQDTANPLPSAYAAMTLWLYVPLPWPTGGSGTPWWMLEVQVTFSFGYPPNGCVGSGCGALHLGRCGSDEFGDGPGVVGQPLTRPATQPLTTWSERNPPKSEFCVSE